ncbi:MAG: hypothetical protein ABW318_20680 [Vicinamibacterales bacterium]
MMLMIVMFTPGTVLANTGDASAFNTKYSTAGTRIDATTNCQVCHTSSNPVLNGPALNGYGSAYKANGRNSGAFEAIKSLDSDGDGFTNLVEIQARTFPGNAADKPFTVGGTMSGLTGSVTLRNNGVDSLVRSTTGPFTFATPLATGSPYAVTVFSQPAGQTCAVINGSGNIASANVTNIVVTCSPTSPITSFDLNQHGLTGSWYEAATSGQGVEVEVFPSSSGTGSTFVSWFTYDTGIGGAERQRWYTAQGQVVTGQPSATLTIFRNTGGNFNAPPITTPQPVGTATLSFDTCASGQLSYSFTDGTGRTGSIPLTRLMQNVTCSVFSVRSTNADFALSGNWYGGPATSGQGLTVELNPVSGALFAAWYTYAPNGAGTGAAGQRWYTVQAAFTPGMRSIPVTIYETTGGVFDAPTPTSQKTLAVGTGTMTFQSCAAATFSYTFTSGSSSGRSGTITLSRVGPIPPGCTT